MVIPMTIMWLLMLPFVLPIIIVAFPFVAPLALIGTALGEILPNIDFLRYLGEWIAIFLGLYTP